MKRIVGKVVALGIACLCLASCSGDTAKSGGQGGSGKGGGTGAGGVGGNGTAPDEDLCAGLVQDLLPHNQTALAKPAVGQAVVDAEFGTTIRRITQSTSAEGNVIKPMYSTIPTWNADESLMILYAVNVGHLLYDGRTYQLLHALDINPADLEQVYWHTSDPDVFFYPEMGTRNFIRYHVGTSRREVAGTFDDICGANEGITNGSDPMFTSWDSTKIGLACGSWNSGSALYTGKSIMYDIANNKVLGTKAISSTQVGPVPPQVSPSGTLAYDEAGGGTVEDLTLKTLRTLQLRQPENHASLGLLLNGHDTWNGAVYDPYEGNPDDEDVGILVTWDLVTATKRVIIGPKTGYPYPPDGHISALVFQHPGWVVVSTLSDNRGTTQGLLDQEVLLANTNDGKVCRIGRHRTWGKAGPQGYWGEAHAVPSPSGTRVVFGSDWGGGATLDTYVIELPRYKQGHRGVEAQDGKHFVQNEGLFCESCGEHRVVAFSCKGRAISPSCLGRPMSAGAANLVARVVLDVEPNN